MIFILNRLETIVATISNTGDPSKVTPYFDDKLCQDLTTGSETFEFTTLGDSSQAQFITVGNFVAFRYNNDFKLFEIVEVQEEHSGAYLKTAYCETAGYELLNNPVRPRTIGNIDVKGLLKDLLDGTSWEVGNVQETLQDLHSIEITEYDTVYKAIQDLIIGKFGAEVSYRVEFSNGKISKRCIDLYQEKGRSTGIRFDYKANMDKVKRTADISNLATALIGVGSNGITFKEIYADDKPSNQDFICNQEAYERWNVKGNHIIRTFEAETDSPGELLVLTRKELENRCKPHMTYEVEVNLLGQTVELGDTVLVIDNDFIPALQISARISKLEGSLSNPASGKCVLTNFKEIKSKIINDQPIVNVDEVSRLYAGITEIDGEGVRIANTSLSNHTTMDAEGMDIQSAGKTVASFRLTTRIPELYADKIVSETIASKDEYYTEAFVRYYVNGTTGDDIKGTGSDSAPFKSLQKAFELLPDVVNTSTAFMVSGSIPSFRLYGKTGAGLIKVYLDQSVIVNGDIFIESMMNGVQLQGQNTKSTIKGQVVIDRCRHVDVSLMNFKMANSRANNVKITDTNTVLVSGCDMGYTTASGSCISAYGSNVFAYNNKGSNVTYYLSTTGYSTFTLPRTGTTTVVPNYSSAVIQYATGDNGTSRLLDGGTYTKTASDTFNPTYVASSKTNTFKPTSIYSSETLSGWADRPELIQGYYSAWSTGRWTGYIKFNDATIRSTLTGATNLSGRLYLQRQSTNHGATTGTLKLYGSDGTSINTSTTFTKGQGVWISLSSTVISKIQSGAIKYFYVKADSSSQSTYIKFESNVVLEITYKN